MKARERPTVYVHRDFFNLLNPYALLGGLTTLTLFATHGAIFLALKTDGEIRVRANKLAGQIGLVATVSRWSSCCGRSWPSATRPGRGRWSWRRSAGWRVWLNRAGREGWAFLFSAITLAGPSPSCSACCTRT